METTLDPGLVAQRRAKRLQMMVLALVGVAGLMLASLVLPWITVKVAGGNMALPTGEVLRLRGGSITRTGIQAGMVTPVLVNASILGLVAFSAYKRWWVVGAGALVILWREGIHVPLPVARGAVTMVSGGVGYQLVSVLYPLGLALILVTVLQTLAVRTAEKEARAQDSPGVGLPVAGLLTRLVGAAVGAVRAGAGTPPASVTATATRTEDTTEGTAA